MKKFLSIVMISLGLSANAQFNQIDFPQDYIYSMEFYTEDVGVLLFQHGNFVKTTDGGQTWDSINVGYGSSLNGIHFFSEDEFIITGGAWYPTQYYASNLIVSTSDGGNSFETISAGTNGAVIHTVDFIDADNGIFLGSYEAFTTNDGGVTVDTLELEGEPYFNRPSAVAYPSEDALYLLYSKYTAQHGYQFILAKSSNGGQLATIISDNEFTNGPVHSLHFLNDDFGHVIGRDGFCIRTTDGGLSWNNIVVDPYVDLIQVEFLTETLGYVLGWDETTDISYLYETQDSGETWTKLLIDTNLFASSMSIAANEIYIGGAQKLFSYKIDSTLISVGVNEVSKAQFSLFPNPGRQLIQLKFESHIEGELNVVNILGETLLHKTVLGDTTSIDASLLPQGSYCAIISKDDGSSMLRKFIVD